MRQKNYGEAIKFLKKVVALVNDDNPGIELYFFDIGYCHLKLNEFDEALYWLSKSYGKYNHNKANFNTKNYQNLLSSYSYVLKQQKSMEQADKIDRESSEIFDH